MTVGILGYGAALPRARVTVETIATLRHEDPAPVAGGLKLTEKTVPASDEDSVTLGVAAAQEALLRSGVRPEDIGALYCGSESKVYAVKPNAALIGGALGVGPAYYAADLEFACKAGTAAMQTVYALVKSGLCPSGLAIGTDVAQARPGDILEYSAAAGAAAFVIGSGKNLLAEIEATCSVAADVPDFWRNASAPYPVHQERFTGAPAYDDQITRAVNLLFKQTGAGPGDFQHAVFHTPNGKFPLRVGRALGFSAAQLAAGYVVNEIGNTYSAASLLGLVAALDVAKAGERILLASFGSGAGSDAFALRVVKPLSSTDEGVPLRQKMQDKFYLDAAQYALARAASGKEESRHG